MDPFFVNVSVWHHHVSGDHDVIFVVVIFSLSRLVMFQLCWSILPTEVMLYGRICKIAYGWTPGTLQGKSWMAKVSLVMLTATVLGASKRLDFFCLQNCCNSLLHKFNKVMETSHFGYILVHIDMRELQSPKDLSTAHPLCEFLFLHLSKVLCCTESWWLIVMFKNSLRRFELCV